jgi:hypothetical protein
VVAAELRLLRLSTLLSGGPIEIALVEFTVIEGTSESDLHARRHDEVAVGLSF